MKSPGRYSNRSSKSFSLGENSNKCPQDNLIAAIPHEIIPPANKSVKRNELAGRSVTGPKLEPTLIKFDRSQNG
jgi:hypothetical protein